MAEENYTPIDELTSEEHTWYAVRMVGEEIDTLLTAAPDYNEAVGIAHRTSQQFPDFKLTVQKVIGVFMDNTRYDKMTDLNWYGVMPARRKDNYITQIFSNFKDLNDFLQDNRAEKFRFVSLLAE
ncbi:hypothetical protein FO433_02840 [Weissella cibaria]|jgi:hypothetical protein|uniref:hypothetical protein n=1 Tax=Weissella cibaria TaxID=137591 RepID=UPI000E4EBCCD|nr:hypothetical protein [Weissella cibaria]MBU7543404.1 hypothetical protein [Weissella cibaria]MBZ6069916.1 hypothetical protein [Weissella cibaria]MCB5825488.1 hypothetical protein [Weissella cibaria]MCB5857047.1 hypothetical protein [Weissella cibaria]MCB5859306.1 hypothetical protein [Weissella cibaria]